MLMGLVSDETRLPGPEPVGLPWGPHVASAPRTGLPTTWTGTSPRRWGPTCMTSLHPVIAREAPAPDTAAVATAASRVAFLGT